MQLLALLIALPLAVVGQSTTTRAPSSSVVTVRPTASSSVVTVRPTASSSVASSTVVAVPAPTGTPINLTASYDPAYGNAGQSLGTTACSDGPNGLLTKGFTTFGSLPSFPRIGGAFAIAGWNSAACGTCWQLAFKNATTTTTINVLAVDVAVDSFNISPAALNTLTNGRAVELGRVNVVARQIATSACGL
ncbi:Cerato-platanin-domain-containing protein [Coprinopsis sp. MPI-PUGE-AT-0042]|nr:Cerato-platanin-domain-containing protein [Coprinopsis sp. MPI-PUGE-AT-0042]